MQREDNPTEALDVVQRFVTAINRHAPDEVAACFRADYRDEAPARRGEFVRGRDTVRSNFGRLFREVPNIKADLLDAVAGGNTVWLEWRLHGTRSDGSLFEMAGVNIFGLVGGQFATGRIYSELVREAGGIEAQLERMMRGGEPK